MQTNEPATGGGFEAITTIEDLGRYLQGLREKKHVTQESLSTKTGAITGRKITRSRISEIENAKRDRVAERELLTYMRGLKCTPRDIDQAVKVLTRYTAPTAREAPADPKAVPVTPDVYPAGLGGAEDNSTLPEEGSDGDPVAAGHEEEMRESWRQLNTRITPLAASLPQRSRRHRQRHRIVLAAATALAVVTLAELGVKLFLRGESGDQLTAPGSPTALLAPHSALLIADDTSDLIKDVTFPDSSAIRAHQGFTKTSKIRNRLAGRGDAADHAATQQLTEVVPVMPCDVELAGQRRPGTGPRCHSAAAAPGTSDVRGLGVAIDRSRTGADSGAMRGSPLSEQNMGPAQADHTRPRGRSDVWRPWG